ncbi:hypothetical protein KDH_66430 [Dictyobacter sp. S3.2.2.5]|uniref:Uncharacterized protein n=1 Tax=Dictyobacter halimunensis TaxID=3026934 RepID=A0ABQ6FZX8_9CHLR|nr:hypothetical protein KDH_66430 [Dictyobacter sp. S3.2.2.5]
MFEKAKHLKPDALIDKALALYKLGLYDEVIIVYTQAIQINSKLSRAYHGRALAHLALGNYEAAIEDCSQAITYNNMEHKLYITKGNIYFALHRYGEAGNAYNAAIRLDSKNIGVSVNKGRELIEEGEELFELRKYDEAFLAYDHALFFHLIDVEKKRVNAIKGNIMAEKGKELFELKNYKASSVAFWRAIECNPSIQNIYAEKGQFLLNEANTFVKQGNHRKSLEVYNNIISFGYELKKAFISIMELEIAVNDIEEILNSYNIIKSIYGNCCQLETEGDSLVEAFIQAVERGCKLIDAYNTFIQAVLRKGNNYFKQESYEEALNIYNISLSICKDTKSILSKQHEHTNYCLLKGKILTAIGDALFARGHYKNANSTYKQASSLYRDIASSYKFTRLFDIASEKIESLKEKSEKCLECLKSAHKIMAKSNTGEELGLDYSGIMPDAYESTEKVDSSFEEEISDPDDYDENYNQYSHLDLGDEVDKYNERLG